MTTLVANVSIPGLGPSRVFVAELDGVQVLTHVEDDQGREVPVEHLVAGELLVAVARQGLLTPQVAS